MSETVTYVGRDLEAMSFAENYHRWILRLFNPYLGRRLVEVGAGTGSFSELLLERGAEMLAAVEPSAEMHRALTRRLAGQPARGATTVKTYCALFRAVSEQLRAEQPDSILYVNVMEHVRDDEGELAAIEQTLCPGGCLFVFVPALRWLYGSFDEQIGHFRRYAKTELEEKCRRAGLRPILSEYFDCAGIVPWWVKYRVLKSPRLGPGTVKFYDRFVVPAEEALESLIRPPLGKNIILVAEKRQGH